MSCPICDKKELYCKCDSDAKRLYEELEAAKQEVSGLSARVAAQSAVIVLEVSKGMKLEQKVSALRSAALALLREIESDTDGGERRYERYGPLFDAVYNSESR